jgi:hypothetical protein
MASGGKESRMVFDIRGKRRHVVKVVYAILAILMGLSLFLVTGAVNIGSLLGSNSESANGAKVYEEQAARIERKLVKDPENPELLVGLTRAQLNAGNQLVERTAQGEPVYTEETIQKYHEASESWSKYLEATGEPSSSAAQLMAPTFFSLAFYGSRDGHDYEESMQSAAEAAEIVAKKRPNLNSLTTLAYYRYYGFDKAGAAQARTEAVDLTKGKYERENLENQLDKYKELGLQIEKQIKQLNASEQSSGGKESLENPLGGLGGLAPSTLPE